ncbi:MAG: ROK family transcriptional regulator [Actinomycetota bacterium]
MLQSIISTGATSRADIARATDLTPATVSDIVADLVEETIVKKLGTGPSGGGKPPTLFGLNADARSIVAVDLSDGGQTGSVMLLDGTTTHGSTRHQQAPGGETGVEAVISIVDQLVSLAPSPLLGIGIGTPGVVNASGVVVEAPNLGWRNVDLRSRVTAHFDHPVHVVNDSSAAALAEYSFGTVDTSSYVVLKIGDGVGASVMLDGRIHGGSHNAAGEVGHVSIDATGARCRCGRRGCLETVASAPKIAQRLRERLGIASGDMQGVFTDASTRATAHDDEAIKALAGIAESIATVLSTTVAVLDVHHVILSGPLESLGDVFLELLKSAVSRRVLPRLGDNLVITYGQEPDRAVRLGATAFVINRELGVA